MKIPVEAFFIVALMMTNRGIHTLKLFFGGRLIKLFMSDGPTFEAYLGSKKIDSEAFRKAESDMWSTWKVEFEQMHANSFTVQKLNLINLIRRKYHLATPEELKNPTPPAGPGATPAAPKPGRPVIRPKSN